MAPPEGYAPIEGPGRFVISHTCLSAPAARAGGQPPRHTTSGSVSHDSDRHTPRGPLTLQKIAPSRKSPPPVDEAPPISLHSVKSPPEHLRTRSGIGPCCSWERSSIRDGQAMDTARPRHTVRRSSPRRRPSSAPRGGRGSRLSGRRSTRPPLAEPMRANR